jgi:non-heme chloroperoxidase
MSKITTKDGTHIFDKDWGAALPRMPLAADACDAQMAFLGDHGYRVVAHDRHRHGRSDRTGNGNQWTSIPTTWPSLSAN